MGESGQNRLIRDNSTSIDSNYRMPGVSQEVPLAARKWEGEIVSNKHLAPFIREIEIRLRNSEQINFRSGSYIQVDIPAMDINFSSIDVEEQYRDYWYNLGIQTLSMKNPEATFRAYSLANYPAENTIIKLLVRIALPPINKMQGSLVKANAGIGSTWLFSRKPGDKIFFSGPYGDFFLKDSHREMIFIAGGTGMAPMRSHLFHLFRTLKTERKVSFWYGALSQRELFYEGEFGNIERAFPNFSFHVTLYQPIENHPWKGYIGFIHQVINDNYLCKHLKPDEIEYYLCGPPRMHDAIFKLLEKLDVPQEMIDFDDFGGYL